jgi:hypothetical protein
MVRYNMLTCEYCPKQFIETANGLVQKTFHETLHDPEVVNN